MTTRIKKYSVLIIAAVLLIAMAFAGAASAAGDGTKDNPYNATEWNNLGDTPTFSTAGTIYIVDADTTHVIYPKSSATVSTTSVTLDFSGYKGTFAGHGPGTTGDNKGALFDSVTLSDNTLNITGLTMTSVNVTSSGNIIGGIIGNVDGSGMLNFTNCHLVNCSIGGTSCGNPVGGLVGCAGSASVNVEDCSAMHCDVVSSINAIGGLVGYASSASFVRCNVTNSTVASTGGMNVGGLVGAAYSASFDSCGVENTSVYAGSNMVGGLVGLADTTVNKIEGCEVKNCVLVSGSGEYVGGLVGGAYFASGIGNCHVVNCTVSGSGEYVGGLIGDASSDAEGSQTNDVLDSVVSGDVYGTRCTAIKGSSTGSTGGASVVFYQSSGASLTVPIDDFWKLVSWGGKYQGTNYTNLGTYGKAGGYGVGSYEPSEPGPTPATYVEVSNWEQLVENVSGWTDTTNMRTIVLTNDDKGAYKNTTVSSDYNGIPVTGLITITPAEGTGEITIDANQMGRLFDVDGGNLTLIGNGTSATLNLTGAYFSDNGGGINICDWGTFTLNTGVKIINCTSGMNGGGVCVEEGTFNMSGGSITNCCASNAGGGVLVLSDGTFNVNGTATITGNTNGSQTSNVLLASPTGLCLLAGGFTGNIGLSVYSTPSTVGDTFGVAASNATGAGKFFADDNANLIGSISSGKLAWAEKPITYVEVNSWAGLNKSIAEWADTENARTVAVTQDITDRVTGNNTNGIDVKGKIILTTNASPADNEAVIDGKGLGRLFKIKEGGDLTLRGNVSTILNLTGGNADINGIIGDRFGGAVLAEAGNLTFAGYGAKIYNCSAENGGGVFVNTSYTFTMYGGNISNCKSSNGGGVYIKARSNFTMKDGSITKCVASDGGGVYAVGVITMTGGRITENTATSNDSDNGGGVVVTSGKFNVSGSAVISNNTKKGITSNVAVNSDKLTLVGPFTGSIGITTSDGAVAGAQFGTATAGASGAENFIADDNANIVGSISDGKLVWTTAGPTPIDYGITITNKTGSYPLTSNLTKVYDDDGKGYANLSVINTTTGTYTLELYEFKATNAGHTDQPIINASVANLTIVLNGESNLTGSYTDTQGWLYEKKGLIGSAGNLTINGSDSSSKLLVNNTNSEEVAISISSKNDLTIKDAKITAVAKTTNSTGTAIAVLSDSSIVTGENTVVDVNASAVASSHAFYALHGIQVDSNAEVIATANALDGYAYAMSAREIGGSNTDEENYDINIIDAKVTVKSEGTYASYALCSDGNISISGMSSSVDAKATSTVYEAYSIYAVEDLEIDSSANVTAKAQGYSETGALCTKDGNVFLGQDTAVEATAISSADNTSAVLAGNNLTIDSAKQVKAVTTSPKFAFGLQSVGNLAINETADIQVYSTTTATDSPAFAIGSSTGFVSIEGNNTVIYANATGATYGCAIGGTAGLVLKSANTITAIGTTTSFTHGSGVLDIDGLQDYSFSNATDSSKEPKTFKAFKAGWTGGLHSMNSNYSAVKIEKGTVTPEIIVSTNIVNFGTVDLNTTPAGAEGLTQTLNVTNNLDDVVYLSLDSSAEVFEFSPELLTIDSHNKKTYNVSIKSGYQQTVGDYSALLTITNGTKTQYVNLSLSIVNTSGVSKNTTVIPNLPAMEVKKNDDGTQNVTVKTTDVDINDNNIAKIYNATNPTVTLIITNVTNSTVDGNQVIKTNEDSTQTVVYDITKADLKKKGEEKVNYTVSVEYLAVPSQSPVSLTGEFNESYAAKVKAQDSTANVLSMITTTNANPEAADQEIERATITFEIPKNTVTNSNNLRVYHINATGAYKLTPTVKTYDDLTYIIKVNGSGFSAYVVYEEISTPSYSGSTKQTGYTQILSEGQVAPTPYATTTPTVAPTAKPTTVVNPTAKPTTQATTQPTQSSPAPVAGLIAGLGAAALVLTRMRR